MSEPFLAEVKIISFNFPPKGWAFCNGQLMAINQNQALFSLLGTTYGGDGRQTFGLPNLQGRTPIHVGSGFVQGQVGGEESHTLIVSELPVHNHIAQASSNNGNQGLPLNNILARTVNDLYQPSGSNMTTMSSSTLSSVGGSQPHNNLQPFLVLNFIIALQGIFPSRS